VAHRRHHGKTTQRDLPALESKPQRGHEMSIDPS
jgi:hypothetical protein